MTGRPWIPAAIMAGGAALLAGLVGGIGVTTNALPALVGLPALAGGLVGGRANLVAGGSVLLGVGLAVLAVRNGPLPGGREAPAVVLGVAIGLLVAAVITRILDRPGDLAVGGLAALAFGAAYWLAFDAPGVVLSWPPWAVVLLAWAASDAVAAGRQARAARSL